MEMKKYEGFYICGDMSEIVQQQKVQVKKWFFYELSWSRFGNITLERWDDNRKTWMCSVIMKYLKEKGMSIIEALMATAIVGIGFIAVFQMVNFSVNSINTSGERTKASFLSAMVAEGFIG